MTLERFFNRCGHYRVLSAIKTKVVYFDEFEEETVDVLLKKKHTQTNEIVRWVDCWTMNNEQWTYVVLWCVKPSDIVTANKWSGVMFPLKFLLLILCEVYFIRIIRRRRTECHMCEYNIQFLLFYFLILFWFCSLLLVYVCILSVCCAPINVI